MRTSLRKRSEKGESASVSDFAYILYVEDARIIVMSDIQPIACEESGCSLWTWMKGQRVVILISIGFIPL